MSVHRGDLKNSFDAPAYKHRTPDGRSSSELAALAHACTITTTSTPRVAGLANAHQQSDLMRSIDLEHRQLQEGKHALLAALGLLSQELLDCLQAAARDAEDRCAEEEALRAKLEDRLQVQKQHLQLAKQELLQLQRKVHRLSDLAQQGWPFAALCARARVRAQPCECSCKCKVQACPLASAHLGFRCNPDSHALQCMGV